jgi:competence protein ComEC
MLHSKGIRYEQHLPVGDIRKVGLSPTLITRLAEVRRALASKVFNSMLSPGAQHFVVALLLGDSHYIDKMTRAEFSTAGIAHVLALSGLHVGIIALLIYWLLFPLDYMGLKKLRLALTLAAIVLFAVFTGLSPSVVRATVMTGFVFASLIFYLKI